jgi:hypothetical protein
MRDRGGPDPYVVGKPKGLIAPGNIDLFHRPRVPYKGKIATVFSESFNIDGREVLLPRVIGNRVVSPDRAVEHYMKTGEHLGIFKNWRHANAYSNQLHLQQQQIYG